MRSGDRETGGLFSYLSCEERVPDAHPLRPMRAIVDEALEVLSPELVHLHSSPGPTSIAPEKLMRALLLQAFYSIRSERQLMEQLGYNLMFRWFVGLAIDAPVWDPTVYSRNLDRLVEREIGTRFLAAVLRRDRVKTLLSDERFSIDRVLIDAWISMKSFRPREAIGGNGGPGSVLAAGRGNRLLHDTIDRPERAGRERETSRERLHLRNEELTRLNAQLDSRVRELRQRTDDLGNLLNGAGVAVLFLDREYRIRWLTPVMKTLLGAMDSDVGRPVGDFAWRLTGDGLMDDVGSALRNFAPCEREIRSDEGRWYTRRIIPCRTDEGRIDGVVATFIDITERHRSEQETEHARTFAESIVNAARNPLVILDPELRVRSANRAFYSTFRVGPAETEGRPVYELGDGHWNVPELRRLLGRVLPAREAFDDFEVEHEFAAIGRRTMLVSARPLNDRDRILTTFHDVTDRKEEERHRALLMSELSHRVKNALMIVQSLATQTARRSRSVDEFSTVFEARLRALAEAHAHLMDEGWRGADLRALIDRTLAPYVSETDRLDIGGDRAILAPQQAMSLNLSLHELATNAAKYGALSVPTGILAIRWDVVTERTQRRLRLSWHETGVPGTAPPTRKGFGTTLIEQTISYEMRGRADLSFEPDGLRAEITFPLD